MSKSATTLAATAIVTTIIERTCAHCGERTHDHFRKVMTTDGATRYVHEHCLMDYAKNVERAAAAVAGKPNKVEGRFTYRCTVNATRRNDAEALIGCLVAQRNNAWFATGEHEFTSPKWYNLKWHKALMNIAEHCDEGRLVIEIETYDGCPVERIEFTWGSRDELGRFVKKTGEGEAEVMKRVMAATYRVSRAKGKKRK